MSMSPKEYEQKMIYTMVTNFIDDLYQKTGAKAVVTVDTLKLGKDDISPIKSITSLDMLEKRLLAAVPHPLDRNPMRIKSRKLEYVEVRCVFCFIAYQKLGFTLSTIGRFINRDHTSVLHMLRRAEDLLDRDVKFTNLYRIIYDNLNQEHADSI